MRGWVRQYESVRRRGWKPLLTGALLASVALGTRPGAVLAQNPGARIELYLPWAVRASEGGQLGPVRLGRPGGLYDAPFDLALGRPRPRATLRYTLDGSLPGPAHGAEYTEPLHIARSTVLRVFAMDEGFAPSVVTTASYILPEDVLRQTDNRAWEDGLPQTWGIYPEGRLKGEEVPTDDGLRAPVRDLHAATLADDLRALPTLSVVVDPDGLFGLENGIYTHPLERGSASERAASLEWFDGVARRRFQVGAGLRIAGGWSRKPDAMPKHSFALYFRKEYGPTKLDFPLFPDSKVTSFDTLRLRGGQADTFAYFGHKAQYLHDVWGRDTQLAMRQPAAHGRFVHLYLNGWYWGVYDLAEEPTADFAASYLGGKAGDWDVVKDGAFVGDRWTYEAEDGDLAAFEAMLAVVRENPEPAPTDPAMFERLADSLDLPAFVDYHLIQIYADNQDWPEKNWRAMRRRAPGEKWRFLVWDLEHTTGLHDDPVAGLCLPMNPAVRVCGDNADTAGVLGLHGWLRRFADYRLFFADRARQQLVAASPDELVPPGTGALAPVQAARRYAARADVVAEAMRAEAARWSFDNPPPQNKQDNVTFWAYFHEKFGLGYFPSGLDWERERDRLLGQFFPARSALTLAQLCREGLYPPVVAPRLLRAGPKDDPRTVRVAPGSAAAGACPEALAAETIFVTTDGSDPRRPWSGDEALPWSGVPSAGAVALGGSLQIPRYALVRARGAKRTESGWQWSAEVRAPVGTPRVIFSEVMYHPDDDALEFVELQNREPVAVDVSNWRVTGSVSATLPVGTLLAPGGFLVIARDPAAFAAAYSVVAAAAFEGRLGNEGETLRLADADQDPVALLDYGTDGLWPLAPNGHGYSLVPIFPDGPLEDPENWRASRDSGGSPAAPDPTPPEPFVVVNEVLPNPTDRQDGAIELVNRSPRVARIGGWYLSDDPAQPKKMRLPADVVLPPGGMKVIYHDAWGGEEGLQLSAAPGRVVLSAADARGEPTGYMRGVAFGPTEQGVSIGRFRTSQKWAVVPQSRTTFGADDAATPGEFRTGTGWPNAGPLVGPIVISEIQPAPATGWPEFVELLNTSATAIDLGGEAGGRGAWRLDQGVSFAFEPGTIIPAGGYLVVAGISPTVFRGLYGLVDEVNVVGPFVGRLDNAGEWIGLSRRLPDSAGGETLWASKDGIDYALVAPWPTAPTGAGASLERVHTGLFGDEPENWIRIHPGGTPGTANSRLFRITLPWASR